MKTTGTLLSLAAIAALASAGCYRTRFDLAPPQPELPSSAYNDHFHISVINIIEVSRPVDLQRACMGAPPTAIEEQVGILGAIVNAVFSYVIPILSVHNATVYCPMGAPMGVQQPYPPAGGQPYPPPGGQPYPPQGGPQPYPPQGQPPQGQPPQQ
jgi:hypothetical protein